MKHLTLSRGIAVLLLCIGFCQVASSAEGAETPIRDVFPVPAFIAGVFQTGGMVAFDPFQTWEPGTSELASLPAPAEPGTDLDRLPDGPCYDLLPVWSARGFTPHEGTRVLYHPASRLLFARIAPADAPQIRAFCEWPPALWLSEDTWDGDGEFHQTQLRVTAWAVPASGPGDWSFQPGTPRELLALPATARRALNRQTFAVRDGQRSKAETWKAARESPGRTTGGMVTEMEVTMGEDGLTADFNISVDLLCPGKSGSNRMFGILFRHVGLLDQPWIIECGTLPDTPGQRVFLICEQFPVRQVHLAGLDTAQMQALWTGASPIERSVVGELVSDRQLPSRRGPSSDPFAAESENPVTALLPELFGDTPVNDLSALLLDIPGLTPGSVSAWSIGGSLAYLSGPPAELRKIFAFEYAEDQSNAPWPGWTSHVAAKLSIQSPAGTGGEEILWRSRVPVVSGQHSAIWLAPASGEEKSEAPVTGRLDFYSIFEQPAPGEPKAGDGIWTVEVAGEFRAPVCPFPVAFEKLTGTGTAGGIHLRQKVGEGPDGREVILTLDATPGTTAAAAADAIAIGRPRSPLALWWQR